MYVVQGYYYIDNHICILALHVMCVWYRELVSLASSGVSSYLTIGDKWNDGYWWQLTSGSTLNVSTVFCPSQTSASGGTICLQKNYSWESHFGMLYPHCHLNMQGPANQATKGYPLYYHSIQTACPVHHPHGHVVSLPGVHLHMSQLEHVASHQSISSWVWCSWALSIPHLAPGHTLYTWFHVGRPDCLWGSKDEFASAIWEGAETLYKVYAPLGVAICVVFVMFCNRNSQMKKKHVNVVILGVICLHKICLHSLDPNAQPRGWGLSTVNFATPHIP
jgi:hypothetical protein